MIPYHGHPHGCTNVGKKSTCPPNLPLIDRVFDFNSDMYVIYSEFPVGEFAERMRRNHPEWEGMTRQWYNPRRWQGMARRLHRKEEEFAAQKYDLDKITNSPEAHGVNVTELMRSVGVELNWEWPPKHELKSDGYKNNKTYIVSIGGHKL